MAGSSTTHRLLALLLVAGGVTGLVFAGLSLPTLGGVGALMILLLGVIVALYLWAIVVGIALWRGRAHGRRWAPIVFASQIPVLFLPGFSFHWFTGAYFGLMLALGGAEHPLRFAANLGANGEISVGYPSDQLVLGVNVVALVAVVLLLRGSRQRAA